MKNTKVIEKLEERIEKLTSWLNAHRGYEFMDGKKGEKVTNVKNYLAELKDLLTSISFINKEIHIVTKPTMIAKSQEADFTTLEEEGYFFQLLLARSFPNNNIYLLYLEPLSSL